MSTPLHPKAQKGDVVSYRNRDWTVAMRMVSEPQPRRTLLVLQQGERLAKVWLENGKLELPK